MNNKMNMKDSLDIGLNVRLRTFDLIAIGIIINNKSKI